VKSDVLSDVGVEAEGEVRKFDFCMRIATDKAIGLIYSLRIPCIRLLIEL